MESWPLQLQCTTAEGDWQVALTEDTVIDSDGRPLGPGSLRPGMRVVIEGEPSGRLAMRARHISVLSSLP